jgi:hypothetical protein
MEVDYESACSAPEKLIVQPEVIEWHHRSLDATPDGDQGGRPSCCPMSQFQRDLCATGHHSDDAHNRRQQALAYESTHITNAFLHGHLQEHVFSL